MLCCRVKYFSQKPNSKVLLYNNQFGSGPPLPLLFSRTFLTHLHVWLAPSSCPSLYVYTISMTAASGNFSRRLPESDSCAQGTLPPSASGGPLVLSLTLYSLLLQPPPPTLPLLPTNFIQLLHICSLQPSLALAVSRGRNWHIHCTWHPLGISAAQGRMHLLPCFCNNTVLTYLQIYLHDSLPQDRKVGGGTAAWKDLPGIAKYGEERKLTHCELLLRSPAKLYCSKLLFLYTLSLRLIAFRCCRTGLLSPPPMGNWDNLLLNLSAPQSSNHKGAGVTVLAKSQTPGHARDPSTSVTSFLNSYLNKTCFTAPLQSVVFLSSIVS